MKLLIYIAALAPALVAAAGALDGIYRCSISGIVPNQVDSRYMTINGHADGGAVFALVAESASQSVYGYGEGLVTGSTFFGSTVAGGTFSLTSSGAGLSGTIGFLGAPVGFPLGPRQIFNANVSCSKIY